MSKIETIPSEYREWFISLKRQIYAAQQRAVLAVNHELVQMYWNIGANISTRCKQNGWGSKIIHRLADDLKREFPDMKGFSVTNLKYMRMLAEAWSQEEISQAPLDQLTWYHLLTLQTKLISKEERMKYAFLTVQHGWSRNVLVHHIELNTAARIGNAQNNFEVTLAHPQSDLARETLKDP